MKVTKSIGAVISTAACIYLNPALTHAKDAPMPTAPNMTSTQQNAHSYAFKKISGDALELSELKGKVLLVVNTASKCGFTGQYAGLQNLHEKYAEKGLVVIGVPSGDFAGQEFTEEEQVKNFTDEKFEISFPLTEIAHVKGKDAHPFYKWANKQAGFLAGPKWNFHKYVIGKDGNFVQSFGSATKPESQKIVEVIEQELAKN